MHLKKQPPPTQSTEHHLLIIIKNIKQNKQKQEQRADMDDINSCWGALSIMQCSFLSSAEEIEDGSLSSELLLRFWCVRSTWGENEADVTRSGEAAAVCLMSCGSWSLVIGKSILRTVSEVKQHLNMFPEVTFHSSTFSVWNHRESSGDWRTACIALEMAALIL